MAAAGVILLCAAGASATVVHVEVINDAAPAVRIVSPAHGARLPAGAPVTVVVEGDRSERLAMAVNGVDTWQAPGDRLEGRWTPQPGRYRLVAVASRDGSPDAVALAVVVAEEAAPSPAAPAVPPAPPDVGTPGGPAGAEPAGPGAVSVPGAGERPAASRLRPRREPVATPSSPPVARDAAPAAADDAPRPRGDDGWRWALGHVVEFLTSPEKVAWTVAFPLLLIIAAGAYAMLQRFIDGGPKLAWRGRGDADDSVVEF